MEKLIEKSIEKWVVDNSKEIAKSILENRDEVNIPIELFAIVSHADSIRIRIIKALAERNHKIDDCYVSISSKKIEYQATIYFDKQIYSCQYGNHHDSDYSIDKIIDVLDNYLTKYKIPTI